MNLRILVIGKLKESYFREAEAEYTKRLRPYCRLELIELKSAEHMLKAMSGVNAMDRIIALDERGKTMSSQEFASGIVGPFLGGELTGTLTFLIGGADGHPERVRELAHQSLSFGKMTWPHRLIRVALVEQIYRGCRIFRGEPYHRE